MMILQSVYVFGWHTIGCDFVGKWLAVALVKMSSQRSVVTVQTSSVRTQCH